MDGKDALVVICLGANPAAWREGLPKE
jgi:hypothetical protein